MDADNFFAESPSISGDELRELLKRPVDPIAQERHDQAFQRLVGSMTEEEAAGYESRINEMCEVVEGNHRDQA